MTVSLPAGPAVEPLLCPGPSPQAGGGGTMCECVHSCVSTCVFVSVHMWVSIDVRVCTRACVLCSHMCECVCECACVCLQRGVHVCVHACVHVQCGVCPWQLCASSAGSLTRLRPVPPVTLCDLGKSLTLPVPQFARLKMETAAAASPVALVGLSEAAHVRAQRRPGDPPALAAISRGHHSGRGCDHLARSLRTR